MNVPDVASLIDRSRALLVLFGSPRCSVCRAIHPRLKAMCAAHFPKMAFAYVDCTSHPASCAQHSVFSLPEVKVWFERRLTFEWARAFSLEVIRQQIERPYALLYS